MPTIYDYELQEAPDKEEFSVHSWTETGLDCYKISADCSNCPINKTYGFHKGSFNPWKRCYQEKANQLLLSKGATPPNSIAPIERDGTWLLPRLPGDNGHTTARKVREEIVRIVSVLGKATVADVVQALNDSKFHDCSQWQYKPVSKQIFRLRDMGVLDSQADADGLRNTYTVVKKGDE